MGDGLTVRVDDMVGHPDRRRPFSGSRPVSLRLGDVSVNGPMEVSGAIRGTVDGVQADFVAGAVADFVCVRCLTVWSGMVEVEATQHFSTMADEDGYAIVDHMADIGAPATDELALAIPASPLCTPECKGLCPICGTDLNNEPCDGHGGDSDSPFAVLRDLFDP